MVDKISNGQVIETFESASAAARSIGISDCTHISACCRGERSSAYGYV